MKVLRTLERARGLVPRCVLTIGNFDGVHRGHQAILQRVRAEADARGSAAVVLTFDPHPISVLRPAAAPVAVMTLRPRRIGLPDLIDSSLASLLSLTFLTSSSNRFSAWSMVLQS